MPVAHPEGIQMVNCHITVTTEEGVHSYTGLFPSTVRAAFDAVRRFRARNGRVSVKRA